jgi:hypothetical protein
MRALPQKRRNTHVKRPLGRLRHSCSGRSLRRRHSSPQIVKDKIRAAAQIAVIPPTAPPAMALALEEEPLELPELDEGVEAAVTLTEAVLEA